MTCWHAMATCFRNSCSTETSLVILVLGARLWWSEPKNPAEFVLGHVKTAIVCLSLTKNLTWPCFQCAESAVLKAMSSQICDCIGQLPFAQGVLCNCTLHLANLGDCRAVGAFRTVLSPQTTWIGTASYQNEKAESPHSIRKSVDRTTATNGRNGPETSTFKSQVSHESWPTIWYRFLVFYSQRGHEGFNVQPKSSICFHHGAAEVVLRKMPRKMPRRP